MHFRKEDIYGFTRIRLKEDAIPFVRYLTIISLLHVNYSYFPFAFHIIPIGDIQVEQVSAYVM